MRRRSSYDRNHAAGLFGTSGATSKSESRRAVQSPRGFCPDEAITRLRNRWRDTPPDDQPDSTAFVDELDLCPGPQFMALTDLEWYDDLAFLAQRCGCHDCPGPFEDSIFSKQTDLRLPRRQGVCPM